MNRRGFIGLALAAAAAKALPPLPVVAAASPAAAVPVPLKALPREWFTMLPPYHVNCRCIHVRIHEREFSL